MIINPEGKPIPQTDEERRKLADGRRPALFKRMLVFDMDEHVDLDALLRKQLHGKEQSDGGSRREENGRGGHQGGSSANVNGR